VLRIAVAVVAFESEDGAAALNIPARALPDGVTPRAVEVLEVSADPDLSVPTEGDPPLPSSNSSRTGSSSPTRSR